MQADLADPSTMTIAELLRRLYMTGACFWPSNFPGGRVLRIRWQHEQASTTSMLIDLSRFQALPLGNTAE